MQLHNELIPSIIITNPGNGNGKGSASNVTSARWQMQLIFLPSDAICQSDYLTHLNVGQRCLLVNIHSMWDKYKCMSSTQSYSSEETWKCILETWAQADICTCRSLETLLLGKFRKGPNSPSPRHRIHCTLNCQAQIWSWLLNQYPNNFWTFNEIVSFVKHSCYHTSTTRRTNQKYIHSCTHINVCV